MVFHWMTLESVGFLLDTVVDDVKSVGVLLDDVESRLKNDY